MKQPKVTVLMSVHNGGRWLRAAISSILTQEWRDFQFLIIDDASTDDSAAQIESIGDPRIELVRQKENLGLTRSLNAGLKLSKGEYIARQDADDLSLPGRLATQVGFLDRHPDTPLVGARGWLMDGDGRSRGVRDLPVDSASILWLSLLDNPVMHSSAMFRRKVIVEEFGGYDETFPCCQDYELWTRILERYAVRNVPQRLVRVREHEGSVSFVRQEEARELVRRVVRRLVDQRHAALALTDLDVALLCSYRRGLIPSEVAAFHRLLALLGSGDHSVEEKQQAGLAATRANVFGRIGYNLLTQNRSMALAEFSRAWKTCPSAALQLPWVRIAGLFLLGARVRRLRPRWPAP